ncbi:hypothetical protein ACE6H2_006878 [Prunus campanulata]
MNHKHYFEALDKSLSDILLHLNPLDNNVPFGGKPLLLGGDFRQILPVIPGGTREEKSERTVTTKSMEKIVSDSNLPIIGLKKKTSEGSLSTNSPAPRLEVKTSIKEKTNHEKIAKQNPPN